jgi:hypothetical protein
MKILRKCVCLPKYSYKSYKRVVSLCFSHPKGRVEKVFSECGSEASAVPSQRRAHSFSYSISNYQYNSLITIRVLLPTNRLHLSLTLFAFHHLQYPIGRLNHVIFNQKTPQAFFLLFYEFFNLTS